MLRRLFLQLLGLGPVMAKLPRPGSTQHERMVAAAKRIKSVLYWEADKGAVQILVRDIPVSVVAETEFAAIDGDFGGLYLDQASRAAPIKLAFQRGELFFPSGGKAADPDLSNDHTRMDVKLDEAGHP